MKGDTYFHVLSIYTYLLYSICTWLRLLTLNLTLGAHLELLYPLAHHPCFVHPAPFAFPHRWGGLCIVYLGLRVEGRGHRGGGVPRREWRERRGGRAESTGDAAQVEVEGGGSLSRWCTKVCGGVAACVDGEPKWVEGEGRAGADALGMSMGECRGFSMGGGSREGGAGAGKARRSC